MLNNMLILAYQSTVKMNLRKLPFGPTCTMHLFLPKKLLTSLDLRTDSKFAFLSLKKIALALNLQMKISKIMNKREAANMIKTE